MTRIDAAGEQLILRVHGPPAGRSLVFLPGLHGDWTLVASLRKILSQDFRFYEFTYPRTLYWNLADYSREVRRALEAAQVSEAWLLAESFSSQVAWELLRDLQVNPGPLRPHGLILAGGFIAYPAPRLLRLVRNLLARLPVGAWRAIFKVYVRYSTFRHRHAPETREAVAEFVRRRTPEDIRAILHRFDLISSNKPAEAARSIVIPVYALSGVIDPIVPWWLTFPRLRRTCPSLTATKLVWPADHNVLGTEPVRSAEIIRNWIGTTK